jgi:S-adenosylmethionine hydrolase
VRAPLITFLSDYGYDDEFVGVCHGVIARRCPQARTIDITHAIARHDVREGALVLADALAYMPSAVHLAVVDPDVGATGAHARRALALRVAAAGHLLVGPDNGLLMPAGERLGGVIEAFEISRSRERLHPVSRTFHGRDVFAPVAAALAAGEPLAAVGDPLELPGLRTLQLPVAHLADEAVTAHVLRADHFGNLILDALPTQLEQAGLKPGAALSVEVAERIHRATWAATFGDVPAGELLLYEDATRRVAIAVNGGSAAAQLRVGRDEALTVRAA